MKIAIWLLIAALAILMVWLVLAFCRTASRTSRDEESGIIEAKLNEYLEEQSDGRDIDAN